MKKKVKTETTIVDHHDHFYGAGRFRAIGLFLVLIGYFVFHSLDVLYLILTGFIISMALENVVNWMQQRMRRGMAIFIAYLFLIIFVFSGLVIVVPFVIQQLADIINILIAKVNVLQEMIQVQGIEGIVEASVLPMQIKDMLLGSLTTGDGLAGLQTSLLKNISQIVSLGTGYIKNAGGMAFSAMWGVFSGLTQAFIVLIVAVFFSIEKTKVIDFLAGVSGRVDYTKLKLLKLYKQLGYWLKGQLLLCVMIGIMTGIGLWILSWLGIDISSKFTLALIAGLTEFIPYVGPFLGMLPALLIGGVSYGWAGIFAVLILYIIIQQSEGNILVPMVMHHTLGVSPLLIFLSMVLGGNLFGFLGVVLAVPFAVIMKILFENYKK